MGVKYNSIITCVALNEYYFHLLLLKIIINRNLKVLTKVVSDSLHISSYKATNQGTDHNRIPNDVAKKPIIIGHEFADELVEIVAKWAHKLKADDKFSIQPALYYENGPLGVLSMAGYSYRHIGGNATYVIIPNEVFKTLAIICDKNMGLWSVEAETFLLENALNLNF